MRALLPAVVLTCVGSGCSPGAAADPEAAFATWLAALPAPQPGPAFRCEYQLRLDMQLMMQASSLLVRGRLDVAADGRMAIDMDMEAQMPELPVPVPVDTSKVTGAMHAVFDGSRGWLDARTDAPWMTQGLQAQGIDLTTTVLTLEAATVHRLTEGLALTLQQALSGAGFDAEGVASQDIGPAFWVHMIGRTTEIRSYLDRGDTVEVAFGLDPALLPELPATDAALTREAVDAMTLRMIFDKRSGVTRTARLEHEATMGRDRIALRLELSDIGSDEAEAARFTYAPGERQAMPLDALLQPMLAQLPQAADQDLDF